MYVTREGYQRLQEQLDELVRERDELMKTLGAEAQADGYVDLRENLTFMEKRTRLQTEYVRRIAELRNVLANAKIVEDAEEVDSDPEIIKIGSKVTVEVDGDEMVLVIVGKLEGNIRRGLVSYESPVGQALLGHRTGETVLIQTPGGTEKYKIVQVSYVL